MGIIKDTLHEWKRFEEIQEIECKKVELLISIASEATNEEIDLMTENIIIS